MGKYHSASARTTTKAVSGDMDMITPMIAMAHPVEVVGVIIIFLGIVILNHIGHIRGWWH